MTSVTTIPDRPEAVTADWFTEVLAASVPGAEVSGIQVLEQSSGTTGRMRIALSYACDVGGPASVFVKLAPSEESQRQLVAMTRMGENEARFYEGPAAEVPMAHPRAFFAAHGDDPGEYVMVLEDLVARGASFNSRHDAGDEEHGGRLIEGLARLHAHFWDDPRFTGELSWVEPARRGKAGLHFLEQARAQFEDDFPPVFGELFRVYAEHHERIWDLWDEGEQTLIHGDTHAGNQFTLDGQVGLYDWAVISRSPGIRDVAIYLGNSCPPEVRRAHQDEWLRRYRDTLLEAGVDAPELGVLTDRMRRCALYAWIAATTTAGMGSTWQPIEVGMLGMARATEACADLDTVGALRDAL
jgi:Ser/Thr protein kinase RdoA (MazF antagonist)